MKSADSVQQLLLMVIKGWFLYYLKSATVTLSLKRSLLGFNITNTPQDPHWSGLKGQAGPISVFFFLRRQGVMLLLHINNHCPRTARPPSDSEAFFFIVVEETVWTSVFSLAWRKNGLVPSHKDHSQAQDHRGGMNDAQIRDKVKRGQTKQ